MSPITEILNWYMYELHVNEILKKFWVQDTTLIFQVTAEINALQIFSLHFDINFGVKFWILSMFKNLQMHLLDKWNVIFFFVNWYM